MRGVFSRCTDFFQKERERLIVFSALLLIGAVSFEAGILLGGSMSQLPLRIDVPATAATPDTGRVAGVSDTGVETVTSTAAVTTGGKCAFVGSRNSTLYHFPACAPAKRIKPENVICFTSAEDAEKRGYKAGCLK